jgi:predicted TIM-barrel fold metal-dependent hydrolase
MFGTDLPSTRAPRPYEDHDFALIIEALGAKSARKVLFENAARFYRPSEIG